jgi:hypothetical protein
MMTSFILKGRFSSDEIRRNEPGQDTNACIHPIGCLWFPFDLVKKWKQWGAVFHMAWNNTGMVSF